MLAILVMASVLLAEAGSFEGAAGGQEGSPTNDGFGEGGLLPVLAYPAIAAGVFIFLLALTYAFRSVSKRH